MIAIKLITVGLRMLIRTSSTNIGKGSGECGWINISIGIVVAVKNIILLFRWAMVVSLINRSATSFPLFKPVVDSNFSTINTCFPLLILREQGLEMRYFGSRNCKLWGLLNTHRNHVVDIIQISTSQEFF